jgi:flagellar biosynthesis repressor protein FlbT
MDGTRPRITCSNGCSIESRPAHGSAPVTRASQHQTSKETGMPLRVELKPFERIIIGQSVITNSDNRTSFLIDGDAPILREKDILTAETANTPVKRIYLCVQMMYLENDIPNYQQLYLGFIKELIEAVPSFRDQIELVSNLILSGNLYKALRELRPLIKREEDLLSR